LWSNDAALPSRFANNFLFDEAWLLPTAYHALKIIGHLHLPFGDDNPGCRPVCRVLW
jgi:hypothetical protein